MKLFIIASLLLGTAAAFAPAAAPKAAPLTVREMHVVSSIGSWKKRSKTCQVIRRRGRYYVIDKKNPRNKARQGGAKMKPWKKGRTRRENVDTGSNSPSSRRHACATCPSRRNGSWTHWRSHATAVWPGGASY